jgi:cephalosporin-C deacetylase
MAFFDLPLIQLRDYKPQRDEPADFDAFWKRTLDETAQHPIKARFDRVDYGLRAQHSYDVTFNGFGGQPIKAWLNVPSYRAGPLPVVVEYLGYGGGRGFATDYLLWTSVGYAHLLMDTRGQGSAWSVGDTPDEGGGGSPSVPGFMTQGITDPAKYYYRRVMTDAVRAIEAARSHPDVDSNRVCVSGGSQGGGLSIAAAGLEPAVGVCMPDVPFLCHYRRAATLVDSMPYGEIARWCNTHRAQVEQAFATLSYFDGVNFAPRSTARALFSVALMDNVCPPSTVFAAYNHWAGEKQIKVYEFNGHEGGREFQPVEKVKFLRGIWG